MNHDEAVRLEHLLLHLLKTKRGKTLARGDKFDGVTIDADTLENDTAAVRALWLAVSLLE